MAYASKGIGLLPKRRKNMTKCQDCKTSYTTLCPACDKQIWCITCLNNHVLGCVKYLRQTLDDNKQCLQASQHYNKTYKKKFDIALKHLVDITSFIPENSPLISAIKEAVDRLKD